MAGTSSDEGGVGVPRIRSKIETPRVTGNVSIPFTDTVRTLPGPSMPARRLLPPKTRGTGEPPQSKLSRMNQWPEGLRFILPTKNTLRNFSLLLVHIRCAND